MCEKKLDIRIRISLWCRKSFRYQTTKNVNIYTVKRAYVHVGVKSLLSKMGGSESFTRWLIGCKQVGGKGMGG